MNDEKSLVTAHQNFIDHLKKSGKATSTILAYGADVEQFANQLKKKQITQTTSVTQEMVEEFKNSLKKQKYTEKSISRKLNSLKTFFRYLKERGLIDKDPAALVEHPRYEVKPPRVLSKIEYRALRDACRDDPRMAAVVELFLQTGLRIGELARLELDDIGEREIRVRPYESHSERTVPLNQPAKKALDRYFEVRSKTKSRAVFVTKTGRPMLVRNIRASINRYFRIAGIKKATVNDLRHTFIVHQLSSGTSVTTVQHLVGHKRLSTTEKYLELAEEKNEERVKLEEL
ncbi:MAG TPA: tyrosine-type recombinase/integrase [Patescibacteria group bacterium]|nr:tyrosine-type recombinase/integrase [Patescibacteria group bacterium]